MDKKWNLLKIALSLIFIVLFNLILFLTTKEQSMAFWISYGFIHFSYFMLLISIATIPNVKGTVVFGFPLVYIFWCYFVVTFFVGLIIMCFKDASVNLALIPQLIITAIFVFIYISHFLANSHTIHSECITVESVGYIKRIASDLKVLLATIKDLTLRKRIEELYDAINSSQVSSSLQLADIENDISAKVEALSRLINNHGNKDEVESLRLEILSMITRRNHEIKMIKSQL